MTNYKTEFGMLHPYIFRYYNLFFPAIIAVLLFFSTTAVKAKMGTITIMTEPGDSKIYFNGEYKGQSSSANYDALTVKLPTGKYLLEATKLLEKHELYINKKIDITAESEQTVKLKLEKVPGKIVEKSKEKPVTTPPKKTDNKTIVIDPAELAMVDIPGGSFKMGCVSAKGCEANELPVHKVNIPPFSLGKHEVTFELWDKCVEAGGCSFQPNDKGWGRGKRPVMKISHEEITTEFLPWLNTVTTGGYRLPSEAEWEYAARAGSQTVFNTGNCINSNQANFNGKSPFKEEDCVQKEKYIKSTIPVGSYKPNAFGLYDMHGNVWEWTGDCSNENYVDAPTDGSSWQTGDCEQHVLRGGSWHNYARNLRSANRSAYPNKLRFNDNGFRLAKSKPK